MIRYWFLCQIKSKSQIQISEPEFAKVPNAPPALSETNSVNHSRQEQTKSENLQVKGKNDPQGNTTLSILSTTERQKVQVS